MADKPTGTEARLAKRLQKAERELQIQSAVDRVLQRALGMQAPHDIADVVEQTRDALFDLGFEPQITHIAVFDPERDLAQSWHCKADQRVAVRQGYRLSVSALRDTGSKLLMPPRGRTRYQCHRYNRTQMTRELRKWRRAQMPGNPDWSTTGAVDGITYPIYRHHFFFSGGAIGLDLARELTRPEIALGRRIADAFDVAYRRFVELQQRASQNRELTIQNALERVRARALGMQTSDDLAGVVWDLFEQARGLGYPVVTVQIVTRTSEHGADRWTASLLDERQDNARPGHVPYTPVQGEDIRAAQERGEPWYVGRLPRSYVKQWRRRAEDHGLKAEIPTKDIVSHRVFYSDGLVAWHAPDQLADDQLAVLRRFTDVFDLAYRRFLELQQSEQRNRELEIDRALERLRADVASMTNSSDLVEVVQRATDSIKELGVPCTVFGISMVDEEAGVWRYHEYDGGTDYPLSVSPVSEWYETWKSGKTTHRQWSRSEMERDMQSLIDAGLTQIGARWREVIDALDGGFWQAGVPFAQGTVAMFRPDGEGPFDDEHVRLLERFTNVLALAYTRFLDFQRVEAEAARARIERAAEHIRAEAMAMRGSNDLMEVVGIMHQSLHELGVEPSHTSIHFVDEDEQLFQHYLAVPDLEPQGFVLRGTPGRTELRAPTKLVEGGWRVRWVTAVSEERWAVWRAGRITTNEEFIADYAAQVHQGDWMWYAPDPDTADWSALDVMYERGHYTQIPFEYGVVTFSGPELIDEHVATVQALTEALSLGYMRFQDFQRLEAQNEQIQQASLNKSQFLRRMSHDLRSPMNAIIGYTRLLQRRLSDRMDEREARNLSNIETSSGNLLDLINDILDLSRIEAGRIEIQARDFDPGQLANECADALESIVKEGVTLVRDLAAVGQISSDPDRLRQVVMNLLGNATKFTEAGSITLSLKKNGDGIELSVADTGIGIPTDDLPHIFDEFRQVERQGGDGAEGTGLGLAIAKKTVELLGGQISATSQINHGTTFTVRLPATEGDVT